MLYKIKRLNPVNILAFVLKEERRSSTLLIAAAVAALFVSNGSLSRGYFTLFGTHYMFASVNLDLRHWINEVLMSLFFLVVSLEVKRELIDGELNHWRKAAFPVFAAAGGMLVPALIFSWLNPYLPQSGGWAIPMATDIAIAVGVLTLLGKRVHKSLRVFLLSLAIIDDIGSIVIISLFYQRPSNILALLLAVCTFVALALVRRSRSWPIYFALGGAIMVYCLLLAGVSATLAGVAVAALMPLRRRGKRSVNLQTSEVIEDILIPVTSFVVVPLFVFANAGLNFGSVSLTTGRGVTVFAGVALGLLLGKPVGIFSAGWLASKLALAHKSPGIRWSQVGSVGMLSGIGFTVSLLVANLSYQQYPALQGAAILGIFCASVAAGLLGLILLDNSLPKLRKA